MDQQIARSLDPILGLTILYGLVVIGVMAVLCTIVLRIPRQYGDTLRDIFRQTRFLELTTVLVIIISATYLAFSAHLSQGIAALLSGVAGYVLGGVAKSTATDKVRTSTDSEKKDPPSPAN
jgi:heme/copper-type cytochrome/quinol oxidase subunit 2